MTRLDGWRVWRSHWDGQPAGWYASRTRRVTDAETACGIYPTLAASSEAELSVKLAQQIEAEARMDTVRTVVAR